MVSLDAVQVYTERPFLIDLHIPIKLFGFASKQRNPRRQQNAIICIALGI